MKITFEDEDEEINLTPLIDVVFVVLIMFILIAPLVEIDRVNLAQAGDSKKKEKASFEEASRVKIHVYQDNTIWLNGVMVSIEELRSELMRIPEKNQRPELFHDRKAFFGTYQSVKNALEGAGFEAIDVILKPG